MTRNQKLEELRVELNSVQTQIANVRYQPPGSVNMATLFQKEAELRTKMYNMQQNPSRSFNTVIL